MAKSHFVKCYYCGEMFDASVVPFIKPVTNRYAHEHCPAQEETSSPLPPVFKAAPPTQLVGIPDAELKDYTTLRDYINEVFDGKVNWATTVGKMKQLRAQQYTYSGMYKALKWWYEIKKSDPKEAKSPLGIIPYIYNDAFDYYQEIFLAEERNKEKKIVLKVREFFIEPPSVATRKPRLFDLDKEVDLTDEK